MENEIPKCPRCGSQLVKIKDKDYWGCPAWLPGQKGCEGTIYYPPGMRKNYYPNLVISYKIESRSHPGHWHQVRVYEDGSVYCPCWAGQTNKFCFHKQEMVKEIEKLLTKISKV